MGRVVILEGPDGGGKTTLARTLERDHGFLYLHEGPPLPNTDIIAYYLDKLNFSLESGRDVVHDRLWLGERFYGPIVRGVDGVGDMGEKLFMRIHNSKPILQYLVTPPITVAFDNYMKKFTDLPLEDVLQNSEKWNRVFVGYCDWFHENEYRRALFDYRIDDVSKILEDLSFIDREGIHLPTGTVGSQRAKYLFIADKPNHDHIDVPFHAVTNSSGYFNEALQLASLKESELAISNAYSPTDGPHDLYEILHSLPLCEHIFLMGRVAQEWFWRRNIQPSSHYKVHKFLHPSFMRRFMGNRPELLANYIRGAINGDLDQ